MPVVVYRVDDRLVHGQVVIGWGKPLNIRCMVLVDDAVAASDWERDLYRMGVPSEIELVFSSVAQAIDQLPGWRADPRNALLLTADVATMAMLCQGAPPVDRVNLGGVHHKPGRTLRLPYVYLSDEEFRVLEGLQAAGTVVAAQDLPTSQPVALEQLR
jgi:PTS system mannose-specific IIB component/fructoselysine and glucoselysine-specific PTS system IIB component